MTLRSSLASLSVRLSAAASVAVWRGLRRWLRMISRYLLAAGFAATSLGIQAQDPTGTLDAQAEYETFAASLEPLYAGLDAIDRHLDKSLFEIEALAEKLATPEAMFSFVRDDIAFEPYVGVLRGAKGTLISRAGNALDRSLLLAALLNRVGVAAQIVHGQLDAPTAEALTARIFEPRKPFLAAFPDTDKLLDDLLTASGIDPTALADQLESIKGADTSLAARVKARTEKLFDSLDAALVEGGVALDLGTDLAALAAETSDHYWVRYAGADGKPVDLDPALPGAMPGQSLTPGDAVYEVDKLPAALFHTIGIRLVLQVKAADATTNTALIEQDFPVALAVADGIRLSTAPVPGPIAALAAGETGVEALQSFVEFIPMLEANGQRVVGKSFDIDGTIYDNLPGSDAGNAERAAKATEKAMTGAGGVLKDLFGDEPDSAPPAGSRITGQWVEYELSAPGADGTPRVTRVRRDMVAPPASLDSLRAMLAWSVELAVVAGPDNPQYRAYQIVSGMLAAREAMEVSTRMALGLPVDVGAASQATSPVTDPQQVAALAQRSIADPGAFEGVAFFHGEAGLYAVEHRMRLEADGRLLTIEGIDIMASGIRAIGPNEVDAALTRALPLQIGVAETVVESELGQLRADQLAAFGQSGIVVSGAALALEHADVSNVPLVALPPTDAGRQQLAALALDGALAAEIDDALASGRLVVLPGARVDTDLGPAWWSIDAGRGSVIGVVPGGRGNDGAEYVSIVQSIVGPGVFLGCILMAQGRDASGKWQDVSGAAVAACLIAAVGSVVGAGVFSKAYASGVVALITTAVAAIVYRLAS